MSDVRENIPVPRDASQATIEQVAQQTRKLPKDSESKSSVPYEKNREQASRTPQEIQRELAETRDRVAATVDTLFERVQPKELASSALASARSLVIDEKGRVRTERLIKVGAGVAGTLAALWALRKLFRR